MSKQQQKVLQKRFKPKFKIKKGDTVKVISGDDKGVTGRVLEVNTKTGRALVEGVNQVVKHAKPSAKYPNGGIIELEAPINISKLMLVDPKTGAPTRVGRKVVDGKIIRYAKKSGEELS
ncbi:50S ribosomal protein L24 [Sphingobacteriales bacterium UPWRP_1]|nr:50S ribosomal protein L24 [Sphingobacteriales bacterium TSM_CSS]PSJ76836.1 50S ribosomal protein L24 [Sphingobacteriales bacterium UPWRP_1]